MKNCKKPSTSPWKMKHMYRRAKKKVANTLKAWCGAHKIKDGMKDHFTGEKLQEQIHRMTTNALTSRLHPDDNELKEIIERQMKYYTVA